MFAYPLNFQHNIVELEDDSCRVRKTGYASMLETLVFMKTLCNYLIKNPDPTIVPVYAFEDYGWQSSGSYMYTYDMERMYSLSRSEKDIINRLLDYNVLCDATNSHPELISFIKTIIQLKRYTDINSGNIMLDAEGQYRLIDLESFFHAPLNHPQNLWFQ